MYLKKKTILKGITVFILKIYKKLYNIIKQYYLCHDKEYALTITMTKRKNANQKIIQEGHITY